ncbi:MAG: hypothetical protein PHT36_00470 [Patescibacteria group bacterium]|nr:hypothetical protein [Patescibacteria group bacterium]
MKKNLNKKAALSWDANDYRDLGEEAPECVYFGRTEGESMSEEDLGEWLREQIQTLSIIKEENSNLFKENHQRFLLDLDYLFELGKITREEYEEYQREEVLDFGKQN